HSVNEFRNGDAVIDRVRQDFAFGCNSSSWHKFRNADTLVRMSAKHEHSLIARKYQSVSITNIAEKRDVADKSVRVPIYFLSASLLRISNGPGCGSRRPRHPAFRGSRDNEHPASLLRGRRE